MRTSDWSRGVFAILITETCPLKKLMVIVKIQISEKWRRLSFNQEIPCVYPFPGYCSCSDTRNIWLFFKEE